LNLRLPFNTATSLWQDQEGLVEGNNRFTYKEFGARVSALAQAFQKLGVRDDSRIAVVAPNGLRFMECYFATALAGLVLVPVNFRLAAPEMAAIFADAGISLIVAHTDFAEQVVAAATMAEGLGKGDIVWLNSGQAHQSLSGYDYEQLINGNLGAPTPDALLDSDTLAQIYYTSGTTGKAKGVMLSHGNVGFHALAVASELILSEKDVWLHVAPMFHLADAWSVFSLTWFGGKHVFVPYFRVEDVLDVIERENVTMTAMVPSMVNALIHSDSLKARKFPNLRMLMTAVAPIAPELVRKVVDIFDCDYRQFYGMTETSPFLTISTPKNYLVEKLSREELLVLKSSTGRPFIGVELKVVRPDGNPVNANNKEVGEIIARGPGVTKGYWKNAKATAETIIDGWLHTGDLAVVNSEGYVNVVDRIKDMIITGGENVYSTEVEYALHEHPSVLECAVFGIPHAEWGEAVQATVVLKPNEQVEEQALIAFLKGRIAGYKVPRKIHFLPTLPKTGSGKIFKRGLKEQFAGKS